jgi:D-alanyl-D-alanine carboxypeptidase (penicillin-binding protein 5/6)
MTKIMTAYIVFDKLKNNELKLSDKFIISANAAKKGGSKMFLKSGQNVSVDALLNGIIVLSGNDASIAIAEGLYARESAFVEKMNTEVKKLGLNNSNFKNSSGWPEDGHFMSARDLAILSYHLIKNFHEYYHYHGRKKYSFNNINQNNRNISLGIDGIDGIKTGRTDLAGYGIVLSAKRNGRRLIAVVNGLKSENDRRIESEKLLNYGFMKFKNITLCKVNKQVFETEVIYGVLNHITLAVKDEVILTVPVEYDPINSLILVTEFQGPLEAPLKKGEVVGKLKIMTSKDRLLIKEVDLVIGTDVEKAGIIKRLFQDIKYFFTKKFNNKL